MGERENFEGAVRKLAAVAEGDQHNAQTEATARDAVAAYAASCRLSPRSLDGQGLTVTAIVSAIEAHAGAARVAGLADVAKVWEHAVSVLHLAQARGLLKKAGVRGGGHVLDLDKPAGHSAVEEALRDAGQLAAVLLRHPEGEDDVCRTGDLTWVPLAKGRDALCVLFIRDEEKLRGLILRAVGKPGDSPTRVRGEATIHPAEVDKLGQVKPGTVILSTATGVRWDMVTAMVEAPPTPPQPAA